MLVVNGGSTDCGQRSSRHFVPICRAEGVGAPAGGDTPWVMTTSGSSGSPLTLQEILKGRDGRRRPDLTLWQVRYVLSKAGKCLSRGEDAGPDERNGYGADKEEPNRQVREID